MKEYKVFRIRLKMGVEDLQVKEIADNLNLLAKEGYKLKKIIDDEFFVMERKIKAKKPTTKSMSMALRAYKAPDLP